MHLCWTHFLHKGSRTTLYQIMPFLSLLSKKQKTQLHVSQEQTGERESKIEEGAAKNQKDRGRERRVQEAKEKKMLFPFMFKINKFISISTLGANIYELLWKSIEAYKHKGKLSSNQCGTKRNDKVFLNTPTPTYCWEMFVKHGIQSATIPANHNLASLLSFPTIRHSKCTYVLPIRQRHQVK